ncbi:hypothetical protein LOK49_LG10G00994 [Camellia lanceoleosa]|uniref:Uncharacterized protein n=1 Tax=Camellia lanceoleosa TaxID=1840588 RepID=A0ACC0GDC1_9ERIC|nr:hypothetical protein LOK49_LG10G00994 [Camellia lanceoleosa]
MENQGWGSEFEEERDTERKERNEQEEDMKAYPAVHVPKEMEINVLQEGSQENNPNFIAVFVARIVGLIEELKELKGTVLPEGEGGLRKEEWMELLPEKIEPIEEAPEVSVIDGQYQFMETYDPS